jgi:3-dehydroquinate synthase
MIGTFYPASKLHFCTDFILSLNETEYLSGLAEVIKTSMLYAPKLFQILKTEHEKIKAKDKEQLYQIVKRCVLAKSSIVEKDISETGLRKQLNLGHTFGHALESVAGFGKISHGQAVAWGLGRAIELSCKLGLCEEDYKTDVFELLNLYGYSTENLPKIIADKENVQDALLKAMKQDKKNDATGITFILQREINSTLIETVAEKDILSVL